MLSFSVIVISVRPLALATAIAALRQQRYPAFEVIVVLGPGGEGALLGPDIRIERCRERNVSLARNVGLDAARGEIVAFLDDDAIPEPTWLSELAAGYGDPAVDAVGGTVLGPDGFWPQYGATVGTRLGHVRFDARPPFDRELTPGADPFLFLQGANMSFRRARLASIGGFDENLALAQDDMDVCLRLIDSGARVVNLTNARVIHRPMARPDRLGDGFASDPRPEIAAFAYFATRHGRARHTAAEIDAAVTERAAALMAEAERAAGHGRLGEADLKRFGDRLAEGRADGERRAHGAQPFAARANRSARQRRRFSTLPGITEGRRVALLAPASALAEMRSLALDLALRGHEVHVLTPGSGERAASFEPPLWIHELAVGGGCELAQAAAYYHEACTLDARREVQLVVAPLTAGCGLLCALDRRSPPVVILPALSTDDPLEARVLELEPLVAAPVGDEVLDALALAGRRERTAGLAARLAAMIGETFGTPPADAAALACRLLDADRYPIDFELEILRAWRLSDDEFIDALYRLVTGEQPDAASERYWQAHLRAGGERSDVLSELIRGRVARGLPATLVETTLRKLASSDASAA